MGKGRGLNIFSQIEPNWPLPYSTMPLPWLRDARPKGWVNCFSICASTMPRAQNWTAKCSILKEDKILCPSGYIIYLWCRRGWGWRGWAEDPLLGPGPHLPGLDQPGGGAAPGPAHQQVPHRPDVQPARHLQPLVRPGQAAVVANPDWN